MQASRASSRVLRTFVAGGTQSRALHMTGSATFSNLLNSEKHALNLPRDMAGLQAECQKRKLPTIGSQNELLNRLTAHEMASLRAFSTAVRDLKRPIPQSTSTGASARHFNTSRSLKVVNDSSTIDFSYIPDLEPEARGAPVRVPILPQVTPSKSARAHTAADGEEEVMLPTTLIATTDGIHNHTLSASGDAANIDFQGFVTNFTNKFNGPSDPENPSMAKEIWSGFWEDVLGSKNQGRSKP